MRENRIPVTFAFRDYQRCLNYIKKVQKPIY